MRSSRLAALVFLIPVTPWGVRPAGALAQFATVLAVNQCGQALSLLVSVVAEDHRRQTQGWFSLRPNSQQVLYLAGGNPVTHSTELPFFIYAANTDESLTWTADDLRVQWQGRSYAMQQRDLGVVEGTGPFLRRAVIFNC